jgi:hypothetical protein
VAPAAGVDQLRSFGVLQFLRVRHCRGTCEVCCKKCDGVFSLRFDGGGDSVAGWSQKVVGAQVRAHRGLVNDTSRRLAELLGITCS